MTVVVIRKDCTWKSHFYIRTTKTLLSTIDLPYMVMVNKRQSARISMLLTIHNKSSAYCMLQAIKSMSLQHWSHHHTGTHVQCTITYFLHTVSYIAYTHTLSRFQPQNRGGASATCSILCISSVPGTLAHSHPCTSWTLTKHIDCML